MTCNNRTSVHENQIVNETKDGLKVFCHKCKQINYIKLDCNGRYDNKLYAKVFKGDCLQPSENLYYKDRANLMSTI
jgi:hypothetical protein